MNSELLIESVFEMISTKYNQLHQVYLVQRCKEGYYKYSFSTEPFKSIKLYVETTHFMLLKISLKDDS